MAIKEYNKGYTEGGERLELLDYVNKTLKPDLVEEMKGGSKIPIAAACFSIYAFQELKAQLKKVEELR